MNIKTSAQNVALKILFPTKKKSKKSADMQLNYDSLIDRLIRVAP